MQELQGGLASGGCGAGVGEWCSCRRIPISIHSYVELYESKPGGRVAKTAAGITPSVLSVSSMAEFSTLVSERIGSNGPLWFRGVRDSDNHKLIPSLYRKPAPSGSSFEAVEVELLQAFRLKSPPFLTSPLPVENGDGVGDLETLFIMQHYGVPTRLLDWTANPFVALFFALTAGRIPTAPTPDAAVWMMDPLALNEVSLAHSTKVTRRIFPVQDDNLHGYAPGEISKKMPLAIYGAHNSQRIVAQRGAFVLFGSDEQPMNIQPGVVGGTVLTKVIIPGSSIGKMFDTLFKMGITDSVVFPDLDGLAREIAYEHVR